MPLYRREYLTRQLTHPRTIVENQAATVAGNHCTLSQSRMLAANANMCDLAAEIQRCCSYHPATLKNIEGPECFLNIVSPELRA
jgi:hypothetical protein